MIQKLIPLPWEAIRQSNYKSKGVHPGFSFIIHGLSARTVSQDCPLHKGSHSSIASLLTLCLSMCLWGGRWEVVLGQSFFMWTVIWHLLDMQRSSYLTASAKHETRYEVGTTQECLGITLNLKVCIFCSVLCKIGKTLGNNLLTCREQCEYFIRHLLTNGLNWRSGRGHAFNFEESATTQVWELSWRAAWLHSQSKS